MRQALSIAVLLLSGCNRVDDPANIPQRGHWETRLKLVALTIDDRSIDRSEAPFAIPVDRTEDRGCFEPRVRTIDEANALFAQMSENQCHFESLDHAGTSIFGRGRCAPRARNGVTTGGTFTLTGEEAAGRVKGIQAVDAFAHLPEGQTVRAHVAYSVTAERLGDCGR